MAVASFAQLRAGATVAPDDTSSNKPLQSAVDAAPANATEAFVIEIAPGTYKGHLVVPANKPFITFQGTDAARTIITDDKNVLAVDAKGRKLSTPDSTTVVLQGHDFTAENITFENTAGNHGQALAVYITGDRSTFRNCRFLGWQDTLRPQKGRSFFDRCQITGHVDFIYGDGTSFFDHCGIHVLSDGYITAASTPAAAPFGFVFRNCIITAEPNVKRTFLGRPWRANACVAFLNCELPKQIPPAGWDNWGNAENEKTARYAEYKNTGPGANTSDRAPWSHQLTDDEAKSYTIERILSGADHWNPAMPATKDPK
jgi:pectinesterase